MQTPIADFIQRYNSGRFARFHMPGHKGKSFLGCEHLDITEINGADALYEAEGIIAESEKNASSLFGSAKTLYSTEGSSQCIRAILYLALTCRGDSSAPVIVAFRNVHKAFVYSAALLGFDIVWQWPEKRTSLCGCHVTPQQLEDTLSAMPAPPAAVYITSPDYLGSMADIAAFSEICHRYGTILAVDNAHGAYLRFLSPSLHPLDLGADICCDSAHKTLPVLTGGAYLHIAKNAPVSFAENAKNALALFGSTSPSYLTLASLDLCNAYIAGGYPENLAKTSALLDDIRHELSSAGWRTEDTDPLRLTVAAPEGISGTELAGRLRLDGIECEYADREYLVLMLTPENDTEDLKKLTTVLGKCPSRYISPPELPLSMGEQVLSVREAVFAPCETIPAENAPGRICGAPTVSCPPAIPVVISGERIGAEALELFAHYGISSVSVLKDI